MLLVIYCYALRQPIKNNDLIPLSQILSVVHWALTCWSKSSRTLEIVAMRKWIQSPHCILFGLKRRRTNLFSLSCILWIIWVFVDFDVLKGRTNQKYVNCDNGTYISIWDICNKDVKERIGISAWWIVQVAKVWTMHERAFTTLWGIHTQQPYEAICKRVCAIADLSSFVVYLPHG